MYFLFGIIMIYIIMIILGEFYKAGYRKGYKKAKKNIKNLQGNNK